MLTAIVDKENEKFKLNSVDSGHLLSLRNGKIDKNNLVCPVCHDNLIFVKEGSDGTVAHFRHKSKAQHKSLSESQEHVEGKIFVKERFDNKKRVSSMKSGFNTDLEQVIRPNFSVDSSLEFFNRKFEVGDLVLNDEFVFEIQLSKIGWSEVKKRTEYYSRNGYKVVWILGPKYISLDKKGRYVVSDLLYKMKNLLNGNLFFYSSKYDKILSARFMNFSAKTRASSLKVIPVEFSQYRSNINEFDHGFVDVFGLANNSYKDYKSASKLRNSRFRTLNPGVNHH